MQEVSFYNYEKVQAYGQYSYIMLHLLFIKERNDISRKTNDFRGDKNMSIQEGKGKRNKNLPILRLDVAVRIKAYELHVQYDAHSYTVTKSKAVTEWCRH